MRTHTFRMLTLALLLGVFVVMPAQAQRLRMDNLDNLFAKASETVDVTIDGSLIKLSAKFLSSNKPDEAAVKELVSALQGIYVKGVEFDSDDQFTENDIESVRIQLRAPGWERIVGVRSKRDRENAEVYLMMQGETITGIGAIVWDKRHFYVVNVVGPIDPEKIGQLRGHFGIPDIDFDFGGVSDRKYKHKVKIKADNN